mmetsp:Transcript_36257/g.91274  ORF Transcript_36257/g.91274 Transcript_36257/m.91274 type:complete len:209 (+) Transcript_36257:182-808(+)
MPELRPWGAGPGPDHPARPFVLVEPKCSTWTSMCRQEANCRASSQTYLDSFANRPRVAAESVGARRTVLPEDFWAIDHREWGAYNSASFDSRRYPHMRKFSLTSLGDARASLDEAADPAGLAVASSTGRTWRTNSDISGSASEPTLDLANMVRQSRNAHRTMQKEHALHSRWGTLIQKRKDPLPRLTAATAEGSWSIGGIGAGSGNVR